MNKIKMNLAEKQAEEIYTKIIEKTDLFELANNYQESHPYNTACCFVDIEYEDSDELFYHRYNLDQISKNKKYYQCGGCNYSKGTIIDFCINFFDLSMVNSIKLIDDYFQLDLCLRELEDPDNRAIILTSIRRMNKEYLSNKCPDIFEKDEEELDVFCDESPFEYNKLGGIKND
ncbi:hypothetical protein C8C76_13014 [Halanaerobium saccharolyticum]|jgi:hypothetical protein|uniref:Uncharacterized protein n=1 Tax=Halanaerobium saccharolyticum TaxID=43595 RepID=A0A2T5RH31_9FIRM|nr:hypothetical protein [Halanaerobium saccharolyticum]PTV95024.1 hypothetical protein C8C76_13014 [Halanaerobium saccharolyticum]